MERGIPGLQIHGVAKVCSFSSWMGKHLCTYQVSLGGKRLRRATEMAGEEEAVMGSEASGVGEPTY